MIKRFYKQVDHAPHEDGFAVQLDASPALTPGRNILSVPNESLCVAIAEEWQAQESEINMGLMPLTKLAYSAIDQLKSLSEKREKIIEEIAQYAGTDLLCYRAETPDGLTSLQSRHWDKPIAQTEAALGVKFNIINGINHHLQPSEIIAKFKTEFDQVDGFSLAALHTITTLTGSAILAHILWRGTISSESAWAAACVDEDWQISQWGEDDEAALARVSKLDDFDAACRILSLMQDYG